MILVSCGAGAMTAPAILGSSVTGG